MKIQWKKNWKRPAVVLAVLVAILNAVGIKNRSRKMVEGCDGCCANCTADCDKKEEAEQ